jgi:hypothetical protein
MNLQPTEYDILAGPGAHTHAHPGNTRFRNIVDNYADAYAELNHNARGAMIDEIRRDIANLNPPPRFMRADRNGHWILLTERDIYVKIKQRLRDA